MTSDLAQNARFCSAQYNVDVSTIYSMAAAAGIPTPFDLINLVTCDLCTSEHDEGEDQSCLPPPKKARIDSVSPASSDGEIVGSQESDKMREHVHSLVSDSMTRLDQVDEKHLSFQKSIYCSALPSAALGMFCCKMFIVNEDYILFPYCIRTKGGTLVRPELMRVSNLVQNQERYDVINDILKPLDSLFNADTSDPNSPSFIQFTRSVLQATSDNTLRELTEFCTNVTHVVTELVKNNKNVESQFRTMFERFIAILMNSNDIMETVCTEKYIGEVKFPLKKEELEISGRPDILLTTFGGKVIAVVESKKYYPMLMTFEPVPDPHGSNDEDVKEASNVETKGILKKIKEKPVRALHERLCRDLDSNVCRYMTDSEKKYLNHFLAQIIGKVLCTAGKPDHRAMHMTMQLPEIPKKVVKYGIGQVGFKIFFITVGLNGDSTNKNIKVGDCEAHGLDIFCTRPLDLMLAKDRHIIAATFFAMFNNVTREHSKFLSC